MGKQFTTSSKARPLVEFTIDDDTFHFTAPKTSHLLLGLVESDGGGVGNVKALLDWVGAGLPVEENDRLVERMKDPDDAFDVDTLTEVATFLVAEATARPTK